MTYTFDFLFVGVGVLLSIAFFTLFERKFLGYVHFRKGPSKVFYFGLLQPICDAVKLFSKETLKGYKFLFYYYVGGPFVGLSIMLVLWCVFPSFFGVHGSLFSFIYVFSFMSLGIYFLLFCCWGGLSKYSLLGGYRSVAQVISYEISMIFFGLVLSYVMFCYDFLMFLFFQVGFWFFFFCLVFVAGWFFVCLAESNRTPFDFSESESELVSGFNVEYGGGFFSLIFICEYGMIVFLCYLSVILFGGASFFLLKILFLCFFWVWVRSCMPRYRYDFLMVGAWKVILPLVMSFLLFYVY